MFARPNSQNSRDQGMRSNSKNQLCFQLFVLSLLLLPMQLSAQEETASENSLESYWRTAQEGLKQVDDFVAEVTALPDSVEMKIGNQIAARLNGEFRVVEDWRAQYVRRLGEQLASHAKRQAITYRFNLIRSDTINAYSVAGGHVWLTTSMFDLIGDDEDELVGVLGHEIAHVDYRHCIRSIQYQILLAGIDPEYADYAKFGYRAYQRGYSQLNEFESDQKGALIVHSAGFSPWGLVRVMTKFAAAEPAGSSAGDPETVADAVALAQDFLKTHPASTERKERLIKFIQEKLAPLSSQDPPVKK